MLGIKNHIIELFKNTKGSSIWIIYAIICGIIMGFVGTAFYYCMEWCTNTRLTHSWLIFCLPLGGLLIVACYHMQHVKKDEGTNLVISAIHSNEKLPVNMAPLIFVSTLITHLVGGSSGREGAALQIGGSIANALGKLFKMSEDNKRIMIMCGMSGAFSAVFGTPLAAAFFSMEVVSVGIMHYSALVPCVISSLVAYALAIKFGIHHESFILNNIPAVSISTMVIVAILAILCGLLSIFFCIVLHQSHHAFTRFLKNPYLRVLVGSGILIVLSLIFSSGDYNGTGIHVIQRIFAEGSVVPYAFIIKILFTAITLGCGFKGGEIVPSFYVGAAFGCLFGSLVGLPPELCAAIGMGAVFCGVTNSPITSLLICFELFGFTAWPFFLISIALSYLTSGYYGLYSSQKIIYSKYRTQYINSKTHED